MSTDIRLTLRVDTKKAVADLRSVNTAAREAQGGLHVMGASAKAVSKFMRAAAASSDLLAKSATNMSRFGQAMRVASEHSLTLKASMAGFSGTLGGIQALGQTAAQLRADFKSLGTSMRSITAQMSKIPGVSTRAAAGITKIGTASTKTSTAMASMARFTTLLRNLMGGLGFVLVIRQLGRLTSSLIQANVEMQKITFTLRAAGGSAAGGAEFFRFLRAESLRLGLDLRVAGMEFGKLAAAATASQIPMKDTKKIFTAIAEAGTIMGASGQDMSLMLLAIQQMMSKGKVSSEELRRQLGERLPGAFVLAAKSMGVTTGALDKMLRKGEVIANDFLPGFADTVSEFAAGALPLALQSTQVAINRFKTALFEMKAALGDSLSSTVKSSAVALTDFFKRIEESQKVKDIIANLAETFSNMLAALNSPAMGSIANALDVITSAMKELSRIVAGGGSEMEKFAIGVGLGVIAFLNMVPALTALTAALEVGLSAAAIGFAVLGGAVALVTAGLIAYALYMNKAKRENEEFIRSATALSSSYHGLGNSIDAYEAGLSKFKDTKEALAEAEKGTNKDLISQLQGETAARKAAMVMRRDDLQTRVAEMQAIVDMQRDRKDMLGARLGGATTQKDLDETSRALRDQRRRLEELDAELNVAKNLLGEFEVAMGEVGEKALTATNELDDFGEAMKKLSDSAAASIRALDLFDSGKIDSNEIEFVQSLLEDNIELTDEWAVQYAIAAREAETLGDEVKSIADSTKDAVAEAKKLAAEQEKAAKAAEKAFDSATSKQTRLIFSEVKQRSSAMVGLADIKEKLGLINKEEEDRVRMVEKLAKVAKILNLDTAEYLELLRLINEKSSATGLINQTMKDNMKDIAKSAGNQMKGAISGFFAEWAATGKRNFKGLWDSMKQTFFQALGDMIAEWISTQAKLFAEFLKRKMKERNADGVSKTTSSSSGGGGAGGALGLFATAVMLIMADSAKTYGEHFQIGVMGGVDDSGGVFAGAASSDHTEEARRFEEALKSVAAAIGGIVTDLGAMTIEIQNNGEYFMAKVNDQVVGYFDNFEEAMAASIREGFKSGTFIGIGENVAAVLANSTAETIEQFLAEIDFAKSLDQLGMSEVAIQLGEIDTKFAQLMATGKKLGLSIDDINEARRKEIDTIGDDIRGSYEQYLPGYDAVTEQFADIRQRALDFNQALQLSSLAIEQQILMIRAQIAAIIAEGIVQNGMTAEANAATAALLALEQRLSEFEQQLADNDAARIDMADVDTAEVEARRRRRASGRENRAEQRTDLLTSLEDMIAESLPAFDQQMRDLAKQFDDLRAEAERLGVGMEKVEEAFAVQIQLMVDDIADSLGSFLPQSFRDGIAASIAQIQELERQLQILAWEGSEDAKNQLGLVGEALGALLGQVVDQLDEFFPETFSDRVREGRESLLEIRAAMEDLRRAGVDITEARARWEAALGGFDTMMREALLEPFAQFVGEIGIRQEFAAIAQSIQDITQWGQQFGLTVQQIGDIVAQTGNQLAMGILDNLNKFIKDEDIRRELEYARAVIEIANIRLQIELLAQMGIVSEEMIDRLRAAADLAASAIEDPAFFDSGSNSVTNINNSINSITTSLANMRDELLAQVEAWELLALSEPERELKALNDRFAEMVDLARKTGFSMERLQNAFNIAIDDFWDRMLTPLSDFREGMALDSMSPLTPNQRLTEARGQFDALVQRALGGDLSALQEIPGAAQTLLTEAKGFFASSQGFNDIFMGVQSVLDQLIGNRPDISFGPGGGDGGGGDITTTGTTVTPSPIIIHPPVVHVDVPMDELIEEVRLLRAEVVAFREHEMDADGRAIYALTGINAGVQDIREEVGNGIRNMATPSGSGFGR